MPPIPFLHIPITFCQIEYGFNIKRLHEFFKWDIKVNISSRGYFNLGTLMIGALCSDGLARRLGCGFATKLTCWKKSKVPASDVTNDRKHVRKYKNAQNDSLFKRTTSKVKPHVYVHTAQITDSTIAVAAETTDDLSIITIIKVKTFFMHVKYLQSCKALKSTPKGVILSNTEKLLLNSLKCFVVQPF